jgi:hypothetical protein
VVEAWVGCALRFVVWGVAGVGLRFPVLDVGVYESFVDDEYGDWKLVEIALYRIVGG